MEEETWKQFMSTGKVADYLVYRNVQAEMPDKVQNVRGAAEYGAESGADRHGAVSDTHRGLR